MTSTGSGAKLLPATNDIGNHCDDCVTNIALPFPVSVYGTVFTNTNVGSNGLLNFGSIQANIYISNCVPVRSNPPAFTYTFFPYYDDLRTDIATDTHGIFTATLGATPNRDFVVLWRTTYFASDTLDANFEVILHENSPNLTVTYGSTATVAEGANPGTGIQLNLSRYTAYSCHTDIPAGTIVTYSPGGCPGTPTVTPTGARTSTPTFTATRILSPTPTNTPTPPRSPSPIGSPSRTPSLSPTPTNSPGGSSVTPTSRPTGSAVPTSTSTPRNTPTGTPTPCAMTFTDVHPSDYFYEPVRYLYCRGVVSGYGDGTFRPYNLTTRGQLCKIVVLAEGWPFPYTPPTPTFRDVPTGHAFYSYVETAYYHRIISGYGCGTGCLQFRPENNITRAQLCKIVVLAEKWPIYTPPTPTFWDVLDTDPFYTYVETAYSHGIISGYTCGPDCLEFRPGNNATRGQICKIVYLAVTQP